MLREILQLRSKAESGECGMQVDIIKNGSYLSQLSETVSQKNSFNDQNRFYRDSGMHFLKRYISKWIYGGDVTCVKNPHQTKRHIRLNVGSRTAV